MHRSSGRATPAFSLALFVLMLGCILWLTALGAGLYGSLEASRTANEQTRAARSRAFLGLLPIFEHLGCARLDFLTARFQIKRERRRIQSCANLISRQRCRIEFAQFHKAQHHIAFPIFGANGFSDIYALCHREQHSNAYRYFFAGDRAKREKFAALPVETSHFPSPGDAVAGALLWDRGHIGRKAGI